MFVRLAMNLQMTIVPFYLIHVMGVRDPDENPDEGIAIIIALVPLVQFFCSTIFSLFVYNRLIAYFGNRLIPLFIGCLIITAGSIPFFFMGEKTMWLIFICTAL